MTATAITQEQLIFASQLSVSYFNNYGLVGNDPLFKFIDAIRQQHGNPATATDETRVVKVNIEKTTGTVAAVSAAGAYTGTDFNASRTPLEQLTTLTEQGGTYKLARRNAGKLVNFIASIKLDPAGKEDAQKRFISEGYGDIIMAELASKMRAKVMTDLKTILEAADTTGTVFGDTVIAATATTFNFSNLLSGYDIATANTTFDAIIAALGGQSNQNGDPITFTQPKFLLCSQSKHGAVLREYKKNMTVNEFDRSTINYWNSDMMIVPVDFTTATDAFVFTGVMPLVFYSETPNPDFFIGRDEDENLTLHITWIYSFGWQSRMGVVKVEA